MNLLEIQWFVDRKKQSSKFGIASKILFFHLHNTSRNKFAFLKKKTNQGLKIAAGGALVLGATYYAVNEMSKPDFHPLSTDIVNESTHGGKLFAQAFKNHGVNFIFGLIGGHVAPIFVGCNQVNIIMFSKTLFNHCSNCRLASKSSMFVTKETQFSLQMRWQDAPESQELQ